MLHWHYVMSNYVRAVSSSAVQWVLRSLLCAWSAEAISNVRKRQELADAFAITSVVCRLVVFAWQRLVDAASLVSRSSRIADIRTNAFESSRSARLLLEEAEASTAECTRGHEVDLRPDIRQAEPCVRSGSFSCLQCEIRRDCMLAVLLRQWRCTEVWPVLSSCFRLWSHMLRSRLGVASARLHATQAHLQLARQRHLCKTWGAWRTALAGSAKQSAIRPRPQSSNYSNLELSCILSRGHNHSSVCPPLFTRGIAVFSWQLWSMLQPCNNRAALREMRSGQRKSSEI